MWNQLHPVSVTKDEKKHVQWPCLTLFLHRVLSMEFMHIPKWSRIITEVHRTHIHSVLCCYVKVKPKHKTNISTHISVSMFMTSHAKRLFNNWTGSGLKKTINVFKPKPHKLLNAPVTHMRSKPRVCQSWICLNYAQLSGSYFYNKFVFENNSQPVYLFMRLLV